MRKKGRFDNMPFSPMGGQFMGTRTVSLDAIHYHG